MTKHSFLEQVPTYASLVCVAAMMTLTWNLNRMRHHALVFGFLAIQLLCGIVMLSALIGGVDRKSSLYLQLFFGSLVLPSLLAWTLAMKWAFELPAERPMWMAFLIAVILTVAIPIYLHDLMPPVDAKGSVLFLTVAGIFAFPGFLSVMTTASALNRTETTVHLGLSLFWMFTGLYAYALAAGRSNVNLRWIEAAWMPPAIAILCFGLAAFSLSRAQRETSRAAVHADVAIEEAR